MEAWTEQYDCKQGKSRVTAICAPSVKKKCRYNASIRNAGIMIRDIMCIIDYVVCRCILTLNYALVIMLLYDVLVIL